MTAVACSDVYIVVVCSGGEGAGSKCCRDTGVIREVHLSFALLGELAMGGLDCL